MISKKLGLGAALVIALCVSAFGAASASALPVTAERCVQEEGTPGDWNNGTCTFEVGEGSWHKQPFNETAGIGVANPSAFTLTSTNAGEKFSLKCTGLSGEGSAKDAGEEILGSGIVLTYSGCTVTAPAGKECQVKAGGEGNGKLKTKSLKSVATRTAEKPDAYRNKVTPASGTVFMTIEVNGCTTAALNGSKEVTGSATSVIAENGMFQEFTEKSGSELKFGGQPATLTGSNELAVGESFISLGP